MRMEAMKNAVMGTLAAGLSALAGALGGWDGALKTLVALMAADYVTGVLVAAVWKRSSKSQSGALDSRAGFQGLCRKGVMLLVVWIGARLDALVGGQYARTAVCLFFIGNEGLSLLENVGMMGVPFPKFLKAALESFREKGDAGDA